MRSVVALPRAALGNGMGALRGRIGGLSATAKRRLLMAAGVLALLAALYFAWFRDSSFVAVDDVTVTGLRTEDGARIRARLVAAAEGMTTLHFDEDELMRALPAGAAVAGLEVTTDFPHGMRIHVLQRPPVAVLVAGGQRVTVAGDGSVLKGVKAGALPAIAVGVVPNGKLGRGRALRLVRAAAAAPAPLRRRIERLRQLPGKGLVALLRQGPQVILGDASRLAAKWAAAAAVLADSASLGATYVDVRIPERPVAGGVDVPQPEAEEPVVPAPAPGTTPGATGPGATATPGAAGTTPGAGSGATGTPQPGTAAGAGSPAPTGTAPTTASPTG